MLAPFDDRSRAEACRRWPSVCHVDGTARVQTVTADDSPWLFDVLQAVKRRVAPSIHSSAALRGVVSIPHRLRPPKESQECFAPCRKTGTALILNTSFNTKVSPFAISAPQCFAIQSHKALWGRVRWRCFTPRKVRMHSQMIKCPF